MQTQNTKPPSDTKVEATGAANVFDLVGTLRRLGEDRGLLADLIQVYREDSPALFRRLQLGVQCQSADEVRHAAHSLRGLAANFGATTLNDVLYKLEDFASRGDLESAP